MRSFSKSAVLAAAVVGVFATARADAAPRNRIEIPAGVKASDTIELKDGKKVSAQRFADEMNELQEALENSGGYSLRKKDGKLFRGKQRQAGQEAEAKEAKAAFTTRVAKIRARQANGFKDLVRKRGAAKHRPDAPKLLSSDALDLEGIALGTPVISGTAMAPSKTPTSPTISLNLEPADEPLDANYEEALGKKSQAAIFVAFGLENSGDATKVGCEGSLETGAYLFDNKMSLAKGVLKGSVEDTQATGSLELYLLGKMVDGYPKSGSIALPELKKSINPPEVSLKYKWPPITITIAGSVAGELGMTFTNKQTKSSGSSKGSCTAGVVPYVRGSGRASASVAAIVYKAGVEIDLTIFDIKLPATATIALSSNPLSFKEDLDASIDAKFLDGELAFFVETTLPQKGEKIWDLPDWDRIYTKTLFGWDGFTAKESLAHFSAKQTPFVAK